MQIIPVFKKYRSRCKICSEENCNKDHVCRMKSAKRQNSWDAIAFMKIHVSESEDRECLDCMKETYFCDKHKEDECNQWDKPIMGILQYESKYRGIFDRKIFTHPSIKLEESVKETVNASVENYLHVALQRKLLRDENCKNPSFQPVSLFENKSPNVVEEMLQTVLSKSWRNTTIIAEDSSDLVRLTRV